MKITEIAPKPKEPKKIRAAAYVRVSSDKDAAFHSLEAQEDYYRKYVAAHPEWELVAVFSDNGISGTTTERPAFQKMLEACRYGKIDLVITKSVTRFARNTVTLLETVRELKSLGIDTYFEKEQMHAMSADGELLLTLLAMYAEEEARSASENQKWRIQKLYEQGLPASGHTFGYRLKNRKYEPVPQEAEIIKRIYAMYLSGMGCAKIAKELTIEGGLSPRGAGWSEWCIKDILTNEKYKGDLLLQKYYTPDFRTKKHAVNRGERRQYYVEDSHEPIVDKETFEAVRQERERRRKKYCHAPQDNQKKHLFCGLIRCGCCGSTYKFIRNNKRAVWICPKHWKKGPSICPSRQIPENILIKKTQDVLGLEDITPQILTEKIRKILVPEHHRLIFQLKNAPDTETRWEYPPRSDAWTEEKRQLAREQAYERLRGRKEDK